MPLSSFEISQYKGLKNVRLGGLPGITIIAGPNGVEKSNFLYSLWKEENCKVEKSENLKIVYISPNRTPVSVGMHKSIPIMTDDRSLISKYSSPYQVSQVSNYVPSVLTQYTERRVNEPDFISYFEFKNRLIQLEDNFENAIANKYREGKGVPENYIDDIYKPLRELCQILPTLKFNKIELENEYYKIMFLYNDEIPVEFDELSSGEKDLIALLFPIAELEIYNSLSHHLSGYVKHDDLLILLDSPDIHLHPNLQSNFLSYIRKSITKAKDRGEKLQYIMCTHSESIIQQANQEELFFLTYPKKSDKAYNQLIPASEINPDEYESFLRTFGSSLSTSKPIVLVEGITDKQLLEILFPDIELKCEILYLEGKGKIQTLMDALNKLTPTILKINSRIFAILDKDRKKVIDGKLNLKNKCLILPVYCLENFLLNYKEIYDELMTTSKNKLLSKNITSENELSQFIDNITQTEEFKNNELISRMREELSFHFRINSAVVKEINDKLDEVVNNKKQKIVELIKEKKRNSIGYYSKEEI